MSRIPLRLLSVAVAATVAAGALSACGSTNTRSTGTASATATAVKKGLKVYFIPKDTQNPYEVLADKGGEKALKELGGTVTVSSGTQDTAAAQIPSVQA